MYEHRGQRNKLLIVVMRDSGAIVNGCKRLVFDLTALPHRLGNVAPSKNFILEMKSSFASKTVKYGGNIQLSTGVHNS